MTKPTTATASVSYAELVPHLHDGLKAIDAALAERGTPIPRRRLSAAIHLLEYELIALHDADGNPVFTPGTTKDYFATDWFKVLYLAVESWYRDQYGAVVDQETPKTARGVVFIRGTAFALRVPLLNTTPGTPGETVWLHFLDRVSDDEQVSDWIVTRPNLEKFDPEERDEALRDVRAAASDLRALRVNLMGIKSKGSALDGLLHGIWSHLERAAELLVQGDEHDLRVAQWELQLVVEQTLKAVAEVSVGRFKHTHKVRDLFKDALRNHKLLFDATRFKSWPDWKDMNEFRYGRGPLVDRQEAIARYRLALELARVSARSIADIHFDKFSVEVRKAPWLHVPPRDAQEKR